MKFDLSEDQSRGTLRAQTQAAHKRTAADTIRNHCPLRREAASATPNRAAFRISLTTGIARTGKRNPSPEFDIASAQFVGALARLLVVGAVKLNRARNVAVFVQDIDTVMRH